MIKKNFGIPLAASGFFFSVTYYYTINIDGKIKNGTDRMQITAQAKSWQNPGWLIAIWRDTFYSLGS